MAVERNDEHYLMTSPDGVQKLEIVPLVYWRVPPYLAGDDYPLPRAWLSTEGTEGVSLYDLDTAYRALAAIGMTEADIADALAWIHQRTDLGYRDAASVPWAVRRLVAPAAFV